MRISDVRPSSDSRQRRRSAFAPGRDLADRRKFSAQVRDWNPSTSAPANPRSSDSRIPIGSIRRYVCPANGVWEKWMMRASGRNSRRYIGTSES